MNNLIVKQFKSINYSNLYRSQLIRIKEMHARYTQLRSDALRGRISKELYSVGLGYIKDQLDEIQAFYGG